MNRYLKPMAGLGIALGLAAWSVAPASADIAKSPEVAQTAVRFTFGREVSGEQLAGVVHELRGAVGAVRSLGEAAG